MTASSRRRTKPVSPDTLTLSEFTRNLYKKSPGLRSGQKVKSNDGAIALLMTGEAAAEMRDGISARLSKRTATQPELQEQLRSIVRQLGSTLDAIWIDDWVLVKEKHGSEKE